MFFLDVDDVLELYAEQVGSRRQLVRPELLESAVALPQAAMFGTELYPHLFQKAAALRARSRRTSRSSTATNE